MSEAEELPHEIDELFAELETSIDAVGVSLVHLKDGATANAEIAVHSVTVLADSVEDIRESIAPLPVLHASAAS